MASWCPLPANIGDDYVGFSRGLSIWDGIYFGREEGPNTWNLLCFVVKNWGGETWTSSFRFINWHFLCLSGTLVWE